MVKELSAGDMNDDITPVLDNSGKLEGFDEASVYKDADDNFIVEITGEYSNENREFLITFNADDEIAGLYIEQ